MPPYQLILSYETLFQLVCLGPDFKEIAKKFTYAEVWGLAISKDGLNAFNSRNNDTMVSDFSKYSFLNEFLL